MLKDNRDTYSDLNAIIIVDEQEKTERLRDRDNAYTFLVVAVEAIRRAAYYAL